MRWAALHFGAEEHLLDHIAPLASLASIPLYIEDNPALARRFYPAADIVHDPALNLNWGELASRYDVLVRCGFWPPHLKQMLRDFYGKEMRLVFCPHGFSDKGHHSPLLTPYADQEAVLLYGPLMEEMLQRLAIPLQQTAFIGPYRRHFYRRQAPFYDALVAETLAKLNPNHPTLLYAPTWQDSEDSSSFFSFGRHLIEQTPPHWNLLIKPHPLLEARDPVRYYSLAACAARAPRVLLLEQFPPILPLFARVDAYLGDFSSIGYDFLAEEKPMFFLNPSARAISDPSRRLHACGLPLDLARPFAFIEKHLTRERAGAQRALYRRVYADETVSLERLTRQLKIQEAAKQTPCGDR